MGICSLGWEAFNDKVGRSVLGWKERTRKKLSQAEFEAQSRQSRGRAAVLMSIFERQGEPHFLLTRRTQQVATHKGQICFPGGLEEKADPSLWETALRETEEEIGVSPGEVEFLGRFKDYTSVTGYSVTPFAGYIRKGFTMVANPREVASFLEVPIRFFHETTPLVQRRWGEDRWMTVYFYHYEGQTIWGLTARMIKDLLDFVEK